ncbi:MAG: hypothetical protein WBB76_03395 [Gaiellaceae bacterium]
MTTPNDSNLLERELTQLAEPRATDEALRLAIRAELVERMQPPPRRSRLRLRIAFAAAAVVAVAATSLAALIGTGGSGGPSAADAAILHHALRAVTPPANMILHEKVVTVGGATPFTGEWWQQTSPPYAGRWTKGEPGHLGEGSDNGTTSSSYDPSTNTIYQQPDSAPLTFTDPLSQIRQELNDGRAQLVGTAVINGASLYKINLPNSLVGYFDKNNYRPLYLDDPQRGGSIVRLKVVDLRYLPMTPANQQLLSIAAQHPNAQLDTNPNNAPTGK